MYLLSTVDSDARTPYFWLVSADTFTVINLYALISVHLTWVDFFLFRFSLFYPFFCLRNMIGPNWGVTRAQSAHTYTHTVCVSHTHMHAPALAVRSPFSVCPTYPLPSYRNFPFFTSKGNSINYTEQTGQRNVDDDVLIINWEQQQQRESIDNLIPRFWLIHTRYFPILSILSHHYFVLCVKYTQNTSHHIIITRCIRFIHTWTFLFYST